MLAFQDTCIAVSLKASPSSPGKRVNDSLRRGSHEYFTSPLPTGHCSHRSLLSITHCSITCPSSFQAWERSNVVAELTYFLYFSSFLRVRLAGDATSGSVKQSPVKRRCSAVRPMRMKNGLCDQWAGENGQQTIRTMDPLSNDQWCL